MTTIIDRFEGEYAVCEQTEEGQEPDFVNIPRVLLPQGVREGDCLVRGPDGAWAMDQAQTIARRRAIHRRLAALYNTEE